jgi:3-oxocholest-4-en-26-oyl-CoA dehydrogenase alpha subunit
MDFGFVRLDSDQRALAARVRAFFAEHVTPETLEHERITGDGFNEQVHLAMGEQGWIMPGWPVESGGAGLDFVSTRLIELEMYRAKTPNVTLSTTRLAVSAVEKHADPSIREDVLRGVAAGTVRICLGYTEPDGGSDIAAAKVRAVRAKHGGQGDDWVINGSKIFTTGAQNCQYTFLITRTDPDAPKHRGLTMFLVPLDTPGVEIQAVRTYGGERTNVVYYGDVRISDVYRLGGVNEGWAVLRGPLDSEHGLSGGELARKLPGFPQGRMYGTELARALEVAVAWAVTPGPDGTRPADDPLVRYQLGKVKIELEATMVTPGLMGRIKGSDALIEGAAALTDLLGPEGVLSKGTPGAPSGGEIDYAHRFAQGTATYGGSVEVYRAMVAEHVLGLPRPAYPGAKVLVPKKR